MLRNKKDLVAQVFFVPNWIASITIARARAVPIAPILELAALHQ
jgi:hypothetical protein